MFTLAGLPGAPPQPLYLDHLSPALNEQVVARPALAATAPHAPAFIGLDHPGFSRLVWADRCVPRAKLEEPADHSLPLPLKTLAGPLPRAVAPLDLDMSLGPLLSVPEPGLRCLSSEMGEACLPQVLLVHWVCIVLDRPPGGVPGEERPPVPTRGGQVQKLSTPTPPPSKSIPSEEGGPTGRQRVEIVSPPTQGARGQGPYACRGHGPGRSGDGGRGRDGGRG